MEHAAVQMFRKAWGLPGERALTAGPTVNDHSFFGVLDEMATNWILSRRRCELPSAADAIVDRFVGAVWAPSSGPPRKHQGRRP